MGADLICFISIGPCRFRKRAVERAIRHAKQVQKEANRLYEILEEAEAAEARDGNEAALLAEKADKLFEKPIFSGVKCQAGIDSADQFKDNGFLVEMIEEDVEKLVKNFVEWWRTCEGRDTAGRSLPSDKNQKIVVCGEMSWGDSPEGYGYTTMNRAYWYEIPERLGIH